MSDESERHEDEPNDREAVQQHAGGLTGKLWKAFPREELSNRQFALLCHTCGLLTRVVEGRGGSSRIADNMIEFCSLFESPIKSPAKLNVIDEVLDSGTVFGLTIDEPEHAKRRSGWDWRTK